MEKQQQMGMPAELVAPDVIFPRSYRYLFSPQKSPHLNVLIHSVELDFNNKTFIIKVMEVAATKRLDSQTWVIDLIENKSVDDYTLLAMDGIGNPLYEWKLHSAIPTGHQVRFDYKSSEAVTHTLWFKYESLEVTAMTPFEVISGVETV